MISKEFHLMVNHQSKVNFHWWVHVKFSYSLEFDLILMMCSTRILCTQLILKHIYSIKYSFIFSFAATLWLHYPSIITVSSNMISDHTQTNDAKKRSLFYMSILFCFLHFFTTWHRYWIQFIKANVQTFDIWHANRTICVINGSNNDNPKDLQCLWVDNFNKSWIFPKPEVATHINCKYRNSNCMCHEHIQLMNSSKQVKSNE